MIEGGGSKTFSEARKMLYTQPELSHALLEKISIVFETRNFQKLDDILEAKQELLDDVSRSIENQVARIRTEETSPKNTTLYFSILLETKDLLTAIMSLLETYQEFHISIVEADIEEK